MNVPMIISVMMHRISDVSKLTIIALLSTQHVITKLFVERKPHKLELKLNLNVKQEVK